jgi:asparagine synthase (glutamine-hydrolysing)
MLRHRGPDGYGLYRDDHVGLGHARLSIIDLERGHQPIHNEDRSVWLTFNGEIFNYLELRRDLITRGHRFYTDGDSEVIVHCYEEYGAGAWNKLNGQFAFGLWDSRRRELWLVRDHFGVLPLQYTNTGRHVVFASEAKAIFASGLVRATIDPRGVCEIFTRWSASAPRTAFAGVRSVRPGTALCVGATLEEREVRYWQAEFATRRDLEQLPIDDAADLLEARLSDAVSLRLRADVPVGAYLSGGLDSSIIGSLVRRSESSPLETFSVRFEDPVFDESDEQAGIVALLGTRHHDIICDAASITDRLAEVVWHCEAPQLRTAPVPLFLLSGLVRDAGMKVVLTGEGADELLAGYGIFKEDKVRRFWARDPESAFRASLLARLHPEVRNGDARATEMWQQFFGRGLRETHDLLYSHAIRWQNTSWSTRLLNPDLRAGATFEELGHELEQELPEDWAAWDPLARAQWLEITTFLSPYLLAYQGDRVAMAHGVEARYPFLDPEVAALCLQLPTSLRMPALRDKVVLRRVGSRTLPADIWKRPKRPYRAPMTAPLFDSAGTDLVDELLSPQAVARMGLLDPKAARLLVDKARTRGGRMAGEREEMALVGALTLQILGHGYLESFTPRVEQSRRALDGVPPNVLEDRVAGAALTSGADVPLASGRPSRGPWQ